MLKNHLKIAYRKLVRQKAFAAINIIGLTVSLTGALLIYMYVQNELSYDRFNEKADRIYRLYCAYAEPGEAIYKFASTPPIFMPTLKQEIPEIEAGVRLYDIDNGIIQYGDKVFNETEMYRTDSGFFDIFSAPFLAGNPATALVQPHSVVLSKSTAVKYFGDVSQALGQTLDITSYGKETYQVTGVAEDFPPNAHFHFKALLSMDYAHEQYNRFNWFGHSGAAYVLLPENADVAATQAKIIAMTENALNPIYKEDYGKTYIEHKQAGGLQEYRLQPLTEVHLYSGDIYGAEGNILYVYLFISIGLMLICIASFNYINLSTAQSAREAKSAGIRKVLGSTKGQLYRLFLTESMGVAILSAFMAITLAQILLAFDSSFLHLFIPYANPSLEASALLLLLALAIGLISGLVPARMISAFQPTQVLKGQLVQGKKGNRLRQILVVSQFAVSMGLIICTLLISQQLTYMQNKSLGFDKEHLLVIKNVDKLGDRKGTLKQAISHESFVESASLSYNTIGESHNNAAFTPVEMMEQGQRQLDKVISIPVYIGDRDYLNTLGVDLVIGHLFPPDLPKEHQQIILNEEALRAIGWQNKTEAELIGKIIDVNGLKYELAGIVEDFHFNSLHEKLGPMGIFSHYYQGYEYLMIRIKSGTYQQAIESMQAYWQQLAPEVPFDYSFVDEDLDHLYQAEQNMGMLFRTFASVAIFIACLGLLGLAMFSAERRIKEIGIRKVLGASVNSIVFLLSNNMVKLILLAFLVASPVAWYLMKMWLENFEYRIEISPFTFLLAGGLTLAIALLTISFQTIKAALTNPVKSLRYE